MHHNQTSRLEYFCHQENIFGKQKKLENILKESVKSVKKSSHCTQFAPSIRQEIDFIEIHGAMEVNGIDDYWHGIEKLGGKLVQVGYSLLEKPKLKKMGRNYPHAWAEPIFKLIKLNSPPDFFKLSEIGTSYFWDLA